MGYYEKCYREIGERYGSDYVLRQTAEEAAELAQAALKMIRANRSETPMTPEAARNHLEEELADVRVCTDLVIEALLGESGRHTVGMMTHYKRGRMCGRLLGGDYDEVLADVSDLREGAGDRREL